MVDSGTQTGIFIPLDPISRQRLQALADAQQQPLAEVAADILTSRVELESWELQQIQQGIDELAAGKGIPHDRVQEWLASWGTENELPAPK